MASSRVQYAGEKYETMEQQSEFEKNLFGKTKNTHARTNTDARGYTMVYMRKYIYIYMYIKPRHSSECF